MSSIKSQCQAIWLRAMIEPVKLQFPDGKQAARARFTFYGAVRATNNPELIKAKELVEILTNKKTHTLTIQLKSNNPFHDTFRGQLADIISGEAPLERKNESDGDKDVRGQTDEEITASLERMQAKLEYVEGEGEERKRPGTPYFSREG